MNAMERLALKGRAKAQKILPYVLEAILKNLDWPDTMIGTIESQERMLIVNHLVYRECPWCDQDLSYFEAVADEDYRIGYGSKHLRCVHCGKELVDVVPFIGAVRWGKKESDKAVKIVRPR